MKKSLLLLSILLSLFCTAQKKNIFFKIPNQNFDHSLINYRTTSLSQNNDKVSPKNFNYKKQARYDRNLKTVPEIIVGVLALACVAPFFIDLVQDKEPSEEKIALAAGGVVIGTVAIIGMRAFKKDKKKSGGSYRVMD